jgi:hypothetical protein
VTAGALHGYLPRCAGTDAGCHAICGRPASEQRTIDGSPANLCTTCATDFDEEEKFIMSVINSRHPRWLLGPRVRVDSLRKGERFMSSQGERFAYVRPDEARSGVHHVIGDDGSLTSFAASAEVVPLTPVRVS